MHPEYDPTEQEQNFSLRTYIDIINKRRSTALTVFLIISVITMILALSKVTPLYTSSSTILMERNLSGNKGNLGGYTYWDPQFLPTQTEIIKSKKVALKVVENLELNTRYRSHYLGSNQTEQSFGSNIKTSIKTFLAGLSDDADTQQTNEQLFPASTADNEKNQIAEIVKSGIRVEPVQETRVVNVSYTDTNPQVAKLITDALVQAYIETTVDIKLSTTQHSIRWMTAKAKQERKKLEDSERALQRYMRDNNLITIENRLAIYPEKMSQFTKDLSNAETTRKEIEVLLDQMVKFKDSPKVLESLPIFTENNNLQSLRNQIIKADQRIEELSQKYGPKHPAMLKATNDRNILIGEKELAIIRVTESAQKSYELAKSNEQNLRELLNSAKNELLDVNERFVQYSAMKREVEANKGLYDALSTSIKTTNMTEESQNVNIWVMREASFPLSPSNQKPKRNMLIGFVLAVAAGISIALLVEYMDNTIKGSDDIQNRYDLTVLGAILETKKTDKIENILLEQNMSPVAENYRMIRSSLLLSSADRPPQTILVTSMKAQEGKTSTSLNLARTLSQITGKILLIDADMRKPRLHSVLRVPNEVGLSTYLSGNIEEEIILSTSEDKIDVIPSGPIPPNPVELISSKRMKTLLTEMAQKYDFVIVDSPPIIQLADGLILSTLVDGTVLVTRVGKTTFDIFNAGLKKLNEFKPHILGVILNGLSTRISGPQSYYHYYEYYSEDKPKRRKSD